MVFALTWTNSDGTFDVVEFDTVDTEDHTLPNEVTEFPVEQGPDITDNVRVKPRLLSVKGYISDSPLYQNHDVLLKADYQSVTAVLPDRPDYAPKTFDVDVPGSPIQPNLSSLVGAGLNALFGSKQQVTPLVRGPDKPAPKQVVQVLKFSSFESRVRATFDLLKKAAGRGKDGDKPIIRAVTDFDEIDGLVVEELTMPRTVDDGTGAVIGFNLKQISIASSLDVAAPKPAEGLGQARKFVGSKAAKDDKDAAEKGAAARKSLAKRIIGSALDFLPGANS